ncbi:NmrA-like family protein [Akanthomyces lecanii RCEF 1005]|uniref:NmrA-like family protein n=1 Tax=Akanthomyces lecanii RCEF 1005 TaxID=1081108 RepID=A0A168FSI1_CORDF|nr:NmrA-like family protein [Akanthomyces lecanii RCEF 1005]
MAITIGIAGITGKFARLVVSNLLQYKEVDIRGFCRDPAKLPRDVLSSPRVTVVQGNATDRDAIRQFAKGCNVIVCCYLGDDTLMTEGQKLLVDACELEKVERYVASDYCLDYTKLEYGQHPAKDPMKKVKAYLEEERKSVRGVHVLIGAFMETFWGKFFGIFDADEVQFSYYGTGDELWESTTYGTAAEYVAAIAADRNAVGMFHLLGDRKSIRQIAEEFAQVYGKQAQLRNLGSLDDLFKAMQTRFQNEPSNVWAWMPLFYQYYCTNGQTYLKQDLDNKKYANIEPTTFRGFMSSHEMDKLGNA